MNINILEKATRMALRGKKIDNSSMLTPAEHKSLEALSSQIAINVRAVTGSGTAAIPNIYRSGWA